MSRLDDIFLVVKSETYVITAAGTSLQMSPLITTEHHRLPQNSRNYLAFPFRPIVFEKPGGRDFGRHTGSTNHPLPLYLAVIQISVGKNGPRLCAAPALGMVFTMKFALSGELQRRVWALPREDDRVALKVRPTRSIKMR